MRWQAGQRGEEPQPRQGAALQDQALEAGLGADGFQRAGREDELLEGEAGEVGHGRQAVQGHHLGLVTAVDGQARQGAAEERGGQVQDEFRTTSRCVRKACRPRLATRKKNKFAQFVSNLFVSFCHRGVGPPALWRLLPCETTP